MYKMVVLDLDGTLLNSKSVISEKNKAAIQKCKERGIKVVLASGRMHYSMKPIIEELELDENLHVACNGTTIFSLQGFKKNISPIKDEVYKGFIKKLQGERVEILAYSEEDIYYDNAPKLIQLMHEYHEKEPIKIESIAELKNVVKVGIFLESKESEKEEQIRRVIKDHATVLRSHEYFLDVINQDTDKYRAVERLMNQYNIDPTQVIAIGDSENDAEMIQRAGMGVAMLNGSERVKRVAKYITPKSNDEDGVADIIERFALKMIS